MSDRYVDALDACATLVDDRIDCEGRLAGLAVADDQLTLPRPIGTIESIALSPVCTG